MTDSLWYQRYLAERARADRWRQRFWGAMIGHVIAAVVFWWRLLG